MSRLLEQIYLTPVTKENSSLQDDPSIQMDASTQTFRKSVTLHSSYHKLRVGKKPPKPNTLHTCTRLRKDPSASDLTPQVQCTPLAAQLQHELGNP